jgi:hypothetical protein
MPKNLKSKRKLLAIEKAATKKALLEKKRVADLKAEWNEHETLLAELKRDRPAEKAAFQTACGAWAAKDPAACSVWMKHFRTAQECSTARSRIWQIALWVRKEVPGDVLKAAHALADSYGEEAGVHDMIKRVQNDLGFDVGYVAYDPKCDKAGLDDDLWTARKICRQYPPCIEIEEIGGEEDRSMSRVNGFCNYVPKGKGADMLQHLAANFEARKNKLADRTADEPAYPHPLFR